MGQQVVQGTGFEVIGFEFQLHHLPWASSLTFMSPDVSSGKWE